MSGGISMSLGNRKLVVLGIPWDVDTEGLRSYMTKYGGLDDVIVMKDRATGRSRGFGYVTFSSSGDAEKVLSAQHSLNGRVLEVKVATPKEEMLKAPSKKVTRVFVARIPPTVNDESFRSYFEKYGRITDAYMPKDQGSKAHRGIGFVTYENPDSVEKLMGKTHELAGSTIAVDKATPKEETMKFWGKAYPSIYGPYGIYTNAAARFGAFGSPFGSSPFGAYDYPPALATELANSGIGAAYGAGLWSSPPPPPPNMMGIPPVAPISIPAPPARGIGNKIFVGRLPPDATADDLRRYFSNFGRLLDVYVPKDAKKLSHRGFGFVTFADENVADRVALRSHELLGVQIAVDRATPQDEAGGTTTTTAAYIGQAAVLQGAGGPMRGASAITGSAYGLGYDYHGTWLYSDAGHRPSRMEARYRPY